MPEHRGGTYGCLICMLVLMGVLIWLLFELQRAPYRPPHDMRTLLGGGEIQAVRSLIVVIAFAWVICAAILGGVIWHHRRERRDLAHGSKTTGRDTIPP